MCYFFQGINQIGIFDNDLYLVLISGIFENMVIRYSR